MADDIKTPETTEEAEERAVVFEEALEAILFAAGHPVSYATLSRVFEMTPSKVKDKVFEYSLKYNDPDIPRGVVLLTYGDSCQLSTKQHYLHEIRDALGIKNSKNNWIVFLESDDTITPDYLEEKTKFII